MVLHILTGYQVLGIVCLNQLIGARHTHTYLITISGLRAVIQSKLAMTDKTDKTDRSKKNEKIGRDTSNQ